jgi:DNA polymerase-1
MMFYLDTETTGLNPHTDRVTLVQYMDNVKLTDDLTGEQAMLEQIPTNRPSEAARLIDKVRKTMRNSGDIVVGHNLAFDFAMLDYLPDSIEYFDDTWLLARLAWPDMDNHTLDEVARVVLGRNPYAAYDKKKMQKIAWGSITNLTIEQRKYASLDTWVLHSIYQHPDIQAQRKNPVYIFDKKSVLACLHMQQYGLPVDRENAHKERVKLEARVRDIALPFNANSPKQTKLALGVESTSDKVLAELIADGNQLAEDVRTVRKSLKRANFLHKMEMHHRYMGTIKPSARSGRTTSDHENLQNLPRDVKKLIAVPESMVLISADFAQLELRTIACVARDETMIDLFKSGEDLHNYTAANVFGADFTKDQRQIAKTLNFSLLYGAGAETVRTMLLQQTGIALDVDYVAQLKSQWLRTYSGILQWQRRGSARHDSGGNWQTPGGRRYKSARFTDHLSIENQGAGAEVARIALHKIHSDLLNKSPCLINFVHDSYLVEAENNPEQYKEAARVVYDSMKFGWEFSPLRPIEKFGLEMPVDVGVAYNWKDADALENCIYVLRDGE